MISKSSEKRYRSEKKSSANTLKLSTHFKPKRRKRTTGLKKRSRTSSGIPQTKRRTSSLRTEKWKK
jgi:hypothetical protein